MVNGLKEQKKIIMVISTGYKIIANGYRIGNGKKISYEVKKRRKRGVLLLATYQKGGKRSERGSKW